MIYDEPMEVLGVRVPTSDRERLVELARRKGVKHPELIREIIQHALAKAKAEEERERARPPSQRHKPAQLTMKIRTGA